MNHVCFNNETATNNEIKPKTMSTIDHFAK